MNTFGGFPLVDPQSILAARKRYGRQPIAVSNGLCCPAGRLAAKGWALLPRSSYDLLDRYATDLVLELDTLSLRHLAIVQAQCVTKGIEASKNAVYLIELTDARGILSNQWFQFPTVSAYNVRSPAYPQAYYTTSLNSEAAWTWATMIGDLWNQMSGFLGAFPGLPYIPDGAPEGWWLTGVSAWQKLCDMLDHIGMRIACDLTSTTPYTIVATGAVDTSFAALLSLRASSIRDDSEWIDEGAARVPASVTVYFKRRNEQFGTEETVRRDSPQWTSAPLYTITVAAPSIYSNAVGSHFLWDDFTVRYDIDSVPYAADVTAATAIANQRVEQYYAKISWQTLGYMSRTYAGVLPFAAGSRVDSVTWMQDSTKIERGIPCS